MLKDKGKISVTQLMLLFAAIVYNPIVWYFPHYTAKIAKQAIWICPLLVVISYLFILYLFKMIYDRYGCVSLMDIICDVFSNVFGKSILSLFVIWLTVLVTITLRYYGERLVASITPNTKIELYIIAMLILVSLVLRSGLIVFTRMNEIFYPISISIMIILFSLMLPNVKLENLTPISYLNVSPILQGSATMLSIIFFPYVLFFTDRVSSVKNLFRSGVKVGIFLWVFTTLVLITSVGTIGSQLMAKAPLSFLVAVNYTDILDIIGGFQSFFMISNIFTDFISISVFSYIILKIVSYIFNLRNCKQLINIFMVMIYFLTMVISSNTYELREFISILLPVGIFFQVVMPICLFLVAKIRKKV